MNTENCRVCKKYIERQIVLRECRHSFCHDCILKISKLANRCPKCDGTYDAIVDRVIKQEEIEKKVEVVMISDEEEKQDECCICLDEKVNRAVINACFHSFCFQCICDWAETTTQCPLCRSEFSEIYHDIVNDNTFQTLRVKRTDKRNVRPNRVTTFNDIHPIPTFGAQQNIPISMESTNRLLSRLRQFLASNHRRQVSSSTSNDDEPSLNAHQFRNRALVLNDETQHSTSSGQRNAEAGSSSDQSVTRRGLTRSRAFVVPRGERPVQRENGSTVTAEEHLSPPGFLDRIPRRNARTYDVARIQNEGGPSSNFTSTGITRLQRIRSQSSPTEEPSHATGHSSQSQTAAMTARLSRTVRGRRNLNARSESLNNILSDLQSSSNREASRIRPKRNRLCLNCFANPED